MEYETAISIISCVNSAATLDDVTTGGLLIIKVAMVVVPPILIIVGYLIYRAKCRIDEAMYATLVSRNPAAKARG